MASQKASYCNLKPLHLFHSTGNGFISLAIEDSQILLLTLAAEALDMGSEAREALDELGGMTFIDRYKQRHVRPEVSIYRVGAASVARLMRQLQLDVTQSENPA